MARNVLAVDDSKVMRDMVRLALNGAGFTVREAGDGVEALQRINGDPVDLIITDVNMPNMDGLTFVRHVRSKPGFQRTPILILTTEATDSKKAEGKAAGATGWLVKPFTPDKLLDVVRRVCP
ncbi:response regulator [Azospirillum doebereinerae]|uniref:Response regulator n=1 Tax=Azospirillum doebereinerae TaxID=92933 RepID=A0A3S0X9R0_9PROT|nr:response regulator [Azospirillum doebereinerae]MCG5241334.1 response regulator [Azospirillum doebereinerae]RUQ68068.1 response regulator [Azospirillum doebereinerae]